VSTLHPQCPVSVTTLKRLAAALQHGAATLPFGQLEAYTLIAWVHLMRAAGMLPRQRPKQNAKCSLRS
jgi:hypothetical protein